ncbi:ABC transporter G family member 28 [Cucurbita argyrosperma subsp. argyrosperma]|nr:ABC transporter G family member 28 [Cucurbita argyrosperma subsp. argyrosperma]
MNLKIPMFSSIFLVLVLVGLSWEQFVHSQNVDGNQFASPAAIPFMLSMANAQLSNLSSIINSELSSRFHFCSRDTQADWNKAFNFSSNLKFLSSCLQKTNGDFSKRLCTAAEINFYFDSMILQDPGSGSFLKLNKNCNLTSWSPGCEPGWACSVGPEQSVDLSNSQLFPSRMHDCRACCEGFFCPQGLTCMIPCPLGSYCPNAKLNRTTGVCEPYLYQLPPGRPNHTCGGANIWADVGRSKEMFCPDGSFCPSSTEQIPCESGHYCRMGSTSQNRCFKLTSCDGSATNQDIHAYGVMLLVALSTVLLIIYNFFDQILAARERRLAKSREAAAKSAKATAKAQQRWKAAKDAAKKHATGLQVQLSRKFSRVKNSNTEKHEILNPSEPETDDDLPYSHSHIPTTSSTSSMHIEERNNNQTDLMGIIHEIEKDPDGHEGFHFESGEGFEKHMPKGKHSSTHSQMFRYAYVQLEKEKAQQQQNNNLTFSGVIKMATDPENKRRPPIEVSFKDLNLTLKAKNKHLLRCVTGNIKPGRITAVMGPSGAGKTTFLSALAGKAIGCKTTGSILINGKNESILSYKRIMGFVPQDDIVHGNLTVEENLWFSANCRLSVELSKADKVLIVERVIEFLGLQTVRNSLVGTVEKRGISGGQRKRVNVGLEMVIEPSILLLDEPTYTLFKMFDDLVLLAKGGFTVYHGPAKRVEEYFAGLGINVPERVNPPDHFIDILEGIVTPNADVSYEELPVRWLLHNGYPVPADLQQNSARHASSSASTQTHGTRNSVLVERQPSLAGELWQGMRSNVEEHHDKLRMHFKTKDLSHRSTPGILKQYRYFLGRIGKQRLRDSKIQVIDYLILLLAGACLGSISDVSDQSFALLGKIAALRTFSLDKLEYWRESSSGMSSLAYFLAKDTVDHFNTAIKPLMYLSMFYSFTNPRSSFTNHYVVLLCLLYCVTGIAYALAILFQPGAAQLWSAILPVVLTLFITRTQTSSALKNLSNICYPKWALEALVIANAERYDGVWLMTRCGALNKSGFDLHDWGLCLLLLMVTGVIFRVFSYVCMLIFRRK